MQAVRRFYDPQLGGKVIASALLAFYKALLTERAEALFYRLQARESRRGSAHSLFRRFLHRVNEASSLVR
jgi:hypothetical protein